MLNKVQLIGNLGRDPEVIYTASGAAIAKFSIATTEKWKDKNSGESKEKTEWHRCVCFGRLAEVIGQYVTKGMTIYVEGKLQYGSYEKDGVTHYTTDINVGEMKMLKGGERGERTERQPSSNQAKATKPSAPPPRQDFDDMDDDIPF